MIVWDSRFADATPVASTTASGAAINLTDFRPYTSWTPGALPATVTVDCATAHSADTLGVFNHTLFTGACTIEVRGSTDNFVASDVLLHSYTPTSNSPFIRAFTSASYRYWRIRITGTSAPTLTVVALGVGLPFEIGVPVGFDPLARTVYGQTNISEQGLPLGKAVLFEQWSQQIGIPFVTNTWLRNTFLPAWKAHLRGNPFLFAFDYVTYPTEIYLVESDGNFTAPTISADYSGLNFAIKGVALP